MKEEKIKETVKLQFEIINLFQKNFAKIFHKTVDSPYGLNKNQNRAILIIGAIDNIMPTTLGQCLDLQKGSLTSMIDALEREGLVCRKKDPQDRRKTLISLTEKGKDYRKWFIGELEENTSRILRRLDEKDILAYKESLQIMLTTLKKLD
ncbi:MULTISPECIES: MarR family winged helix-turn-helix transcriptional regulator [Methanosarcina]|uniref:Transcriptional regulator, MarR family n=3 Tax=Methanosarcina barkeri TaxID=2208 RepID=A0A0E3LNL2_METBA|nr:MULTISPECIES: MarR family transcriptional regulator [Methanosarcina]AKB54966.1 Transcriptional regulator, MarR family [Methanosarcina barkeri MS]AKB56964.1 Transcriptional regulator, MarR family [Methanosarcina barkeri 227]AKJ37530.1 MarR family transcriptional regulator [Methanosarcina barkeri CM1]OEC91613.1 MarR family transcriptional regulator [Methanosarcina sp. A14]